MTANEINAGKKTVLVTGAARGLGRAMSQGLAEAGYRVAALDLADTKQDLETLAATMSNGTILPLHCDLTKTEDCEAAMQTARQHFGAVDILVNNAGIGMEVLTPVIHANPFKFYEIEESFWRRVVDINLFGMFRMTKLAAPLMVESGWGRIINVTTSLTTMLKAGFAPYGPSKAGIEAASSIFAKELAGTGVTVNILVPGGPADTRMIPPEDEADREKLVKPAAMIAPVLWLASAAADGVTGRRYQAKLWRTDLPSDEAEQLAGARAAWA